MKTIFLSLLTASLLGTSFLTQAFSLPRDNNFKPSARIGIGYSDTNVEDFTNQDLDFGSGIKIEAGYDINRVFGVQTSLEWNEGSQDFVTIEGMTWKLGGDIGYQLDVDKKLQVKPYAVLGVAYYSQETHSILPTKSFDSTNLYTGFGLRATWEQGLYAAVEYSYTPEVNTYIDMYQFSATIGMKF